MNSQTGTVLRKLFKGNYRVETYIVYILLLLDTFTALWLFSPLLLELDEIRGTFGGWFNCQLLWVCRWERWKTSLLSLLCHSFRSPLLCWMCVLLTVMYEWKGQILEVALEIILIQLHLVKVKICCHNGKGSSII